MTEPEPLYTLAQAEQIIRDRRCARQGHQLRPVQGNNSRVHCDRCERDFQLVPVED